MPSFGPYAREVRLNFLRSQLPDPLPTLNVEEIEAPEGAITPYTFAYVRPLPAPTYRHPEEAAVGLPPLRRVPGRRQLGDGDGVTRLQR